MNAPKIWLQKYVDLSGISDKQFAEKMTFAGNKVEAIHKLDGEVVYEFEITSNRPDTLSIIGLAREAAAIFNRKLSLPKIPEIKKTSPSPIKLSITGKKLCSAYSAIEINHVTIKPSSKPIQKLLRLTGIRPVNNIVDITNYLMWQSGQPMHAFDADKIAGSLLLRAAKPNEVITPLDHKKRTLQGGEIIIEDQKKLVDLAGLMGGLNTEISSETNRVYLLIPIYNPVAIRRASKHLKLRSDASTLFEKQLDLTQTEVIAKRAVKLLEKEANGQPSTKLVTLKSTWKPKTISLSLNTLNSRTGYNFTQKQVDKHLNSISITKTSSGYQTPPWRRDLVEEVDLIEEVTRLYGYNQLPRTLPTGNIPTHPLALKKNWLRKIKNQVASLGYFETYSSTLIGESLINSLNLDPRNHLKVLHPTSKDFEYMRTTILETLLPLIKTNSNHTKNINLFELGTVFHKVKSSNKLPDQPLELGVISTTINYAQLKGQVENLASTLGISLIIKSTLNKTPMLHPSNQAEIYLGKKTIGHLGQTIDKQAWTLTLNITDLISSATSAKKYPDVSSYPAIIEDLTFTLLENSYLGPVIETISSTHKLIKKVTLTKTYQQNYTFNLTYQSLDKPLSDKLVAPIRKKIVQRLSKSHRAKLVGKL